MTKVIPAIIPEAYRHIERQVTLVADIVDTVQIDFVNGITGAPRSWWWNGKDASSLDALLVQDIGLPLWDQMNYEFDLMDTHALDDIDTFIALGPSKIIFHIDLLDTAKLQHFFETMPAIARETISFGIALELDTDIQKVAPFAAYIDTIQCMGIAHIGVQGQPLDPRVFEKIIQVRAQYPDKHISVDGGVTVHNASELVAAGADTLIAGSAVFQAADIYGTIEALCSA